MEPGIRDCTESQGCQVFTDRSQAFPRGSKDAECSAYRTDHRPTLEEIRSRR